MSLKEDLIYMFDIKCKNGEEFHLTSSSVSYKILTSKILVFIGLISYSLYLWHYSIFSIARYVLPDEMSFYNKIFKAYVFSKKRFFLKTFFYGKIKTITNEVFWTVSLDFFRAETKITDMDINMISAETKPRVLSNCKKTL